MTEPRHPPAILAGVGYRNLRDHSLGVKLADELGAKRLPPGVEVQDLSYNPVAVVQWLEAMAPGDRPRRMVFVAAVERGRSPGTVTTYRWDGTLPPEARIQRAVEDAVTGVIFLDNTLIVLGWLSPLSEDAEIVVVEVEPEDEAFGESFSPAVASAYREVVDLAVGLSSGRRSADALPLAPLGGMESGSGPEK
ncbi:MAG: hypothetical protein R3304_10445 [Longimicrobiales bacterium]|nr:hypothetical protein [Longimicrobiales bacterium]